MKRYLMYASLSCLFLSLTGMPVCVYGQELPPPDSLGEVASLRIDSLDGFAEKSIEIGEEKYVAANGDSLEISGFTPPTTETSESYTHPVFQAELLQGEWEWIGAHYKARLQMDNERYYMERFFEDSNSKIGEHYLSYAFLKDSIVLTGLAGDNTHICYWIRLLTPDSMMLQNAETFEISRFKRIGMTFPPMPKRENEFALINNALTCAIDLTTPAAEPNSCLRIGDLNLGWTLDSLEGRFGRPVRFAQSKKDSALYKFVYNLQPFQGTQPELIVTHNSETEELLEIQIRGFGTVEDLTLASIRLGDYISFVEERLGKASDKQWDKETLITKWKYTPYPIVLEFKNKYLNGIKIYKKEEE